MYVAAMEPSLSSRNLHRAQLHRAQLCGSRVGHKHSAITPPPEKENTFPMSAYNKRKFIHLLLMLLKNLITLIKLIPIQYGPPRLCPIILSLLVPIWE